MEIFANSDLMCRPIIGIVGRCSIRNEIPLIATMEYYRRAIINCGGNPILILPPQDTDYFNQKVSKNPPLKIEEKSMLEQQLDLCDGILAPGGFKRFEYDNFVLEYCIKKDKPILGICLGMQMMANYGLKKEDGSIDFKTEKNSEEGINHCNKEEQFVHEVTIKKDSKLYQILKTETFKVNSLHHYHVLSSPIYDIVGYSEDGLIEVVEYKQNKFNIGVQWHPERILNDELQNNLFTTFIKSCKDE